MSSIELQSGIPIPSITRPQRKPKNPFDDMNVNDSSFVATDKANTLQSAINRYMKTAERDDKQFTMRAMSEIVKSQEAKGEQDGYRVWRVQ